MFLLGKTGADPGFSERGSEHRSVSLMQGSGYYNTKIMRFRAYLSKYKELFNQIRSRGCGGCNSYRLFYYIKC